MLHCTWIREYGESWKELQCDFGPTN